MLLMAKGLSLFIWAIVQILSRVTGLLVVLPSNLVVVVVKIYLPSFIKTIATLQHLHKLTEFYFQLHEPYLNKIAVPLK